MEGLTHLVAESLARNGVETSPDPPPPAMVEVVSL